MATDSHPIPFGYRLILLYIEPLLALNGACMLLFSPTSFLASMTPRYDPNATVNASGILYSSLPETVSAVDALAAVRVLTDQLAIMQIVFAFNLGVALRFIRDRTVWRVLCFGMLMSDVLHIAASVRELSCQDALDPALWRGADWANFVILGGAGLVRLAIVLGIGVGAGEVEKPKKS